MIFERSRGDYKVRGQTQSVVAVRFGGAFRVRAAASRIGPVIEPPGRGASPYPGGFGRLLALLFVFQMSAY